MYKEIVKSAEMRIRILPGYELQLQKHKHKINQSLRKTGLGEILFSVQSCKNNLLIDIQSHKQ